MSTRKRSRAIPVLFIRGSEELGQATGFTDKRIHAKWRDEGLPYSVMDNGTFLYDPKEVSAFIKKRYAPQELSAKLTNRMRT